MKVHPKKALGQHFLVDISIAQRIVETLFDSAVVQGYRVAGTLPVLEVGPGTGVLTQFLIEQSNIDFRTVEIDQESIDYLGSRFPLLDGRIIKGDFLKIDLSTLFSSPFLVIGNFPYHISSQILFKVLDHRDLIPVVVGMFQKEVAERITATPGSKTYGILSVLLQVWYHIEYLFTVPQHVFCPPPKVTSAVLRFTRNTRTELPCSELLFNQVVKATFNQRRKMIRNSIKQITQLHPDIEQPLLSMRPEQLSIDQFTELTNFIHTQIEPTYH